MPKPGNQFVVPGMPPELAEIINTHRGLFGGFTMTATPAEGAPAATAVTIPATPDPASPPVTPPPAAAPATPPANPAEGETAEAQIARLTSELAAARAEAGKSRVNAKQAAADEARAALVQELGKALGLVKDEPVDPAVLQQQIAATGTENTTLKAQVQAAETRLAAFTTAASMGVNTAALLDSNSFLKAIEGLAPTDTDKITAAIKTAVTANPALQTQAAKSGPEFTGGTGGQAKPTSLEDAIAAKLGATS